MLKDLVHLFYPETCPACDQPLVKNEGPICLRCETKLPETNFNDLKENHTTNLLLGRIPVQFGYSHFYYLKQSRVQKILRAMKYGNNAKLCKDMGRLIGIRLRDKINPDYILPLPLHPKKMKIRGYNQSAELAKGIREILDIPILTKAAVRIHNNTSQVSKSRSERIENVEDVFGQGKEFNKLQDKHILVVDDVITTGATLEALYSTLSAATDIKISIATLAVA